MSHLSELKNAYFPKNFQQIILAKRRASTSLSDYNIRKQRQSEYVPTLDQTLLCQSCQQPFIQYVNTICKHSFCQNCLQENLLIQHRRCPICKLIFKADHSTPTLNIDYWIKTVMKENIDYKQRLQQIESWKQQIKIDQFEVAMRLDVFDTDFIWCEAEIKRILLKNGQPNQLKIHYIGWTEIYDEVINVSSSRLAKLGTFTQKKNALKYSDVKKGELQRRLIQSATMNPTARHLSLLNTLQLMLNRTNNNNYNNNNNNTN